MPSTRLGRAGTALLLAALCGCRTAAPPPVPGPPRAVSPLPQSPYSEFTRRPPARLSHVQVKLTYLGEQTKPVPTVVFGAIGRLIDLQAFGGLRKAGIDYGNDELPRIESFVVTVDELHAMLQAAALPAVTQGQRDGSWVSFMVLDNAPPGIKGVEAILDPQEAEALVRALRSGVSPRDGPAAAVLDSFLARAF